MQTSVMAAIRRLAELVSRHVVLRRRLPRAFGGQWLYVSPDSALRYWRANLGSVDPQLLNWVIEFVSPGLVVWDVGANNGLFAFAAACAAGQDGLVVAVEPDPRLASLLRRSSARRDCPRADVMVVETAVAEADGVAAFSIAARGRSASHLTNVAGSTQGGGTRRQLEVRTTTLDTLLGQYRPPGLVKIDVEGAEDRCLAGAKILLRQVRPVVLCEVHDAGRATFTRTLTGADYLLFDADLPAGARRPLDDAAWNTLALPSEKAVQGATRQTAP